MQLVNKNSASRNPQTGLVGYGYSVYLLRHTNTEELTINLN